MEYNKMDAAGKGMTRDIRYPHRSGGGPRDQQRRIKNLDMPEASVDTSSAVIKELRLHISSLMKELTSKPQNKDFSAEEVDDEIRKAVLEAIKETERKQKESIIKLETIITNKNKIIEGLGASDSKELLDLVKKVEELTSAVSTNREIQVNVDPDRPKMEEFFIDPLEKDAGSKMEVHVDIKSTSYKDDVKVDEKLDKLRGILGKLPNLKK